MSRRAADDLRAVVCAYGEVGWASLQTLLQRGVDVALVVTHADDPSEACWFHSVGELAREAGVPVILPADVNSPASVEAIERAAPDLLFSFYFRQMIGRRLLALPRRGALNLHGSLLPRFRGRAPVNWVLIEGEKETGVTLHYMDEKPDHGDLVAQRAVAIERDDTALRLTRKLADAARVLLGEVYADLAAGTAPRVPQDHARATYYGGRRPEDGRIDWTQGAERVRNLIRAVTEPWPGAFTTLRSRRLFVWWAETAPGESDRVPGELYLDSRGAPSVATADGALRLCRIGWSGEPPMDAALWARRESIRNGERCGDALCREASSA